MMLRLLWILMTGAMIIVALISLPPAHQPKTWLVFIYCVLTIAATVEFARVYSKAEQAKEDGT